MKNSGFFALFIILFSSSICFSSVDTYLRDTVIFHLDFENGAVASSPDGSKSPQYIRVNSKAINNEELKGKYLVSGLSGMGLSNAESKTSIEVSYPVDKNIHPEYGTVLWWLRYEKLHPSADGGLIFQTHGGRVFYTTGSQGRVCIHGNVPVYQSDLRRVPVPREEGMWTQMGFSWNRDTLHLIVNGKRAASQTLRKPLTSQEIRNSFMVYLFGWAKETDVAVLDEFTIYKRALTEAELLHEYRRFARDDSDTEAVLSPLAVEAYFLPGISRLRTVLSIEGYKDAGRVREVLATVYGPDRKVIKQVKAEGFNNESTTLLIDLPGQLDTGMYSVEAEIYDGSGRKLAGPVKNTFEKKSFPFEGNKLGISDRVLPPWIPMETNKENRQVMVWGREYTFNSIGMPTSIKTQGVELLAKPIFLTAVENNKTAGLQEGSFQWLSVEPHHVDFKGRTETKNMDITVNVHSEYDGMVRYEMVISPRGDGEVDSLDLVIPLKAENLTLMHATSDGVRANYAGVVPEGEGTVWDSTQLRNFSLAGSFIPYVWLGNERLGLCWWADKDEGWQRPADPKQPQIELIRMKDEVQLVLKLFASPVKIREKRSIIFALNATPVRPKPSWERNASIYQGKRRGGKGPFFSWFGSTHWALSGTNGYKNMPYTFTYLRPVDRESEEWLKKRMEEIHSEGMFGLAYTDYRARNFTEETKYYAWEWAKNGTLYTRRWVKNRQIYEGMAVNSTKSRIDYDLWCISENMKLGMDAWYFDEILAIANRNPYAGNGWINRDGLVEGECHLFALREFLKRLYTIMVERGYAEPVIVMHMTDTMFAGPMSFATVTFDYEYTQSDPEKRLLLIRRGLEGFRTTAMGHQYGLVGTVINTEASSPYIVFGDYQPIRNWEGMQLLHGLNFQMNPFTRTGDGVAKILEDFGYFEEECRFIGYWEAEGNLYDVEPDNIKVSVYRHGNKAMLVFLNTKNEDTLALWRPNPKTGMTSNLRDADPMRGYVFWHTNRDQRGFRKIFIPAYDYRLVLVDCHGNW
jgi:hypothetical protein